MIIAVFAPTFIPTLGGAEVALYHILDKISERDDIEIHLFLPYSQKKVFDKKGLTVNYKVHALPPKFVSISFNNKRLAHLYFKLYYEILFRNIRIDAAWFHLFFPLAVGIGAYFQKRNIPYVIAGRGVDIQKNASVNYGFRLNAKYEKKIKQIINHTTKAVAISNSIKDDYISLGMPLNKIAIISNPIETERTLSIEPANLQKELGITPGRKVIITVGRYTPKKGFECIPSIIKELQKIRDDFVWLIVGKNVQENLNIAPDIARHIRFVTSYGTLKKKTFRLQADELIALNKAADIFVFPTIIEGLGNVTLEAMAAGLPVITSDVPGSRDIVTNGVDGILVDAGDVAKFAAEINELIENKEKSNRLVKAAYKTIQKYSTDRIIKEYYNLLWETANQR